MTVADEIVHELQAGRRRRKSGLTADELAALIYVRRNGYSQLVWTSLRQLETAGRIERLGKGGQDDPYTFRIRPEQVKRRKV
jgi:hypothetical protein